MTGHLTTDTIIDYIRGELPERDDAYVHGHLAGCDACRAEYRAEIALGETIKAAAAREELEFPSLIAANVWQTVRDAKPSPLLRLTTFARPAFAVPIAAALVLGTLVTTPFLQSARPSVAASYYFADHAAQEAGNPFSEHMAPAQTLETSDTDDSASTSLADASPNPGDALIATAVADTGIAAGTFDGDR